MAKRKEDSRRPVSEGSRSMWQVQTGPLALALAQLHRAIADSNQLTAARMALADGVNPAEWALDAERMEWVRLNDIK